MNKDLLNILSQGNKEIRNQDIMNYLSDKLTGEQKHELEAAMADSGMMDDALEGLAALKNSDIDVTVDHVNSYLKKYLEKKKASRKKRKIKDMQWQYVAIALLLVVTLIAFILILKHMES